MDDLEEGQDSGRASLSIATAEDDAASPDRWQWVDASLTRRLAFLLLALAGLVWAVIGQGQLGGYAVSGGGAAQVSVPPLLVLLSLLSCSFVAVLLNWRDLRRLRARVLYGSGAESEREELPPTLAMRRWAVFSFPALVWGRIRALRLPGLRAAWPGWLCVSGVLLSLMASLIADLGAWTFAGRPAAQWWWIGSVALLLAAAGASTWLKRWRYAGRPARAARASSLAVFSGNGVVTAGAASRSTGRRGRRRYKRRPAPVSPVSALARRGGVRRAIWEAVGDPLLLVALLEVALLLRLPNLTNLPYIVHGDEAACGLEAYRWLNGGVPSLISVGWYGLPVLGYGIPALVMRVMGADLLGLRLSSVLIGVLSIALLYALARECVGRRAAFVAAGLMTSAHVHIHFSRMGIHYIHAPCVVLLTLWMLVRALRNNSPFAAVVAGIGLSLALQVYFSARIVFVVVPLFLLGLWLWQRHWLKGRWLALGWMLLSFVVAFGPLGVYFLRDTDAFKARPAEVLILNLTEQMRAHLLSQFGTLDLWAIFQRQLAAVPLLVGGLPDQSLQYGPFYPMFDALAAALALIGFFYALLHFKRPLCLLLVIWVVSTAALGGVLTMDMPWWPRLLVMVPALCLLAALALEEILRAVSRLWRSVEWSLAPAAPGRGWRTGALCGALALAVLIYSGAQSTQHYFTDYGQEVNGIPWRALYTDIARYAAQLPAGTEVLLFSDESVIWDYEPIRFLDTRVRGQRVGDAALLPTLLAKRAGPTVIIITLSRVDDFLALLHTPGALPAGIYHPQTGPDGQVAFYVYTLSG